MTVACDVVDCIYNVNNSLCVRDPCMISSGHCEWVYNKHINFNLNQNYNKGKRVNNEQEEI